MIDKDGTLDSLEEFQCSPSIYIPNLGIWEKLGKLHVATRVEGFIILVLQIYICQCNPCLHVVIA